MLTCCWWLHLIPFSFSGFNVRSSFLVFTLQRKVRCWIKWNCRSDKQLGDEGRGGAGIHGVCDIHGDVQKGLGHWEGLTGKHWRKGEDRGKELIPLPSSSLYSFCITMPTTPNKVTGKSILICDLCIGISLKHIWTSSKHTNSVNLYETIDGGVPF